MRKVLAAAIALILIAGGWWYASPLWTLREMQSAAERGDATAFSEYVDYPAVREGVKAQLRRQLLEQAAKSEQQGSFAALGSAAALALMNPLVDAVVTPEGLEAAFAHRKLVAGKHGPGFLQTPSDPVVHRIGINQFKVTDRDPAKGSLVFERSGLGWKLAGFEIPPASTSNAMND